MRKPKMSKTDTPFKKFTIWTLKEKLEGKQKPYTFVIQLDGFGSLISKQSGIIKT